MKSDGLQMLVIKLLFININKPALIGDRYELFTVLMETVGNTHAVGKGNLTASFLRLSNSFSSKTTLLKCLYTLYNSLVLKADPIVWSEDALKFSERNTDGLHENSSKQQN